jgi:hypothetical protein
MRYRGRCSEALNLLEFTVGVGPENGTKVVGLLGLRVTRQYALCNVLAQS